MTTPLPAQNVQVGDPGHVSDHNAVANFLQQAAQEGDLGTSAPYMPYNVRTYGAIGNGTHDDTSSIVAAFQAAETNGGRHVIYFPTGTYKIVGTLPLSNFSSVIRGDGCQNSSAVGGGTTIKATSQTGPVLDFTGYKWPDYGGTAVFSGFNVVGDGTSDPTKVRIGIKIDSAINAAFTDVTISGCGGPGLAISNSSYCSFTRMVITNPLGAKASDVQYLQASSVSGCRFSTILFHSLLSTADVGTSGVLNVKDASGGITSANNVWSDLLFDTLHLPTGSAIIWHKGNTSTFANLAFAGCVKENSSAAATAYFRFSAPVTDSGGNLITGVIPGKGTGTTDIDTGIDMNQSRNMVQGSKGFRGTNVTLESGVGFTTVALSGAAGASTDPGVVNSSGQLTNVIRDDYLGTVTEQNYVLTPKPVSAGGAGVQVSDVLTPAIGALYLGSSGPAVQNGSTEPNSMYLTANKAYFRDLTKALLPMVLSAISGDPSLLLAATGSNLTALRLTGNLDFTTDNTNDIGALAANRPRDITAGRNLQVGNDITGGNRLFVLERPYVNGTQMPEVTAGRVVGITTTAAGRYSWANPIGAIPSGLSITCTSGGTPNNSFTATTISITTSIITVFFCTQAGAQASTTAGVGFNFVLVA